MSTVELRTGSVPFGKEDVTSWRKFGRAYECPVLLCPEEEGGFSVHALTLPGALVRERPSRRHLVTSLRLFRFNRGNT